VREPTIMGVADLQITAALRTMLAEMVLHVPQPTVSVTPIDTGPMQSSLSHRFNSGIQEDAEELLSFLLNAVSTSFRGTSGAVRPVSGSGGPDPTLCLRGWVTQSCQCTVCGTVSGRHETPFFLLPIPIPPGEARVTLSDLLLNELTTEELMSGDNLFACHFCQQAVVGRRHTVIQSPPAILVLQLQRFAMLPNHTTTKKMTRVVLDSTLNLYSSDQETTPYFLYSVVMHVGPRPDAGHYFSICRCSGCAARDGRSRSASGHE
jgi:ubiquitin C-terminal hydrolase